MDEQEIRERLADPTFQQTVFNNLMEVFVLPNIKRRQEKGELSDPLHLMAAQVLPAMEAELNQPVYQAYGLDEDDIRMIEGHMSGVAVGSGDEE